MVKSLQDGINIIESNFQNNMEEDTRNTILILHNYDGQNLAEFRRNLATYGAIKVRTVDGSDGDVKSLKIEVNAENYESILEIFRRAIIENAMGYDAKDERLNGVPNQMNILSMYSDIDLDANDMETEFQASFEDLLFYINSYLENTGEGNFDDAELNIIFNRDIMLSESEAIENCVRSEGILSRETIISQHPWIENVGAELERIKRENIENEDIYGNSFNGINTGMTEDMKRIKIEKDKKSEILNQDKVKKKEEEHE
jgi:SPP1 family phage portal protein